MHRLSRRSRATVVAGAVLFLVAIAFAAAGGGADCCPGAGAAALDRPIASDLEYTVDTLANGMRFYVRAHPSSGDRTELRLVVDAGSVEEADDQRGLAHAVEHMVFRGTRAYPHGAIERYLESVGMRRGDDVNGTTSLDDTQYRMSVPTSRAGAIDTALAMLASIAHEASFDTVDARREAGVLLEEWRSSRGAAARVADARYPLLYAGTRYAARPTIGDTGVLRRFDLGAMRRFYETWYRPELMAVVVVGDFDAKEVEAMVRRHFAGIPRRGTPRPRPTPPEPVPPPASPRATVVADPEDQSSSVGIWQPGPRQRYRTRADYRDAIIAALWRDVLRGRLEDAVLEADSPLATADVERRTLARRMSAEVVTVGAMSGRTLDALDAAAAEMNNLARHGPTAEEFDERTQAALRDARMRAQNGDGNSALAAEFVDHFLTGNAVLTSRVRYEMARDILPTVAVEDVRAFARTHSPDSGAVVAVAATEDDAAARVAADSVAARTRTAAARAPAATRRDESADVRGLLESDPTPGRIVAERTIPEVHAYEWTLSNGMRVILKPTSFAYDEIQFRAVAPGGASLAADDDYASAYLADVILGETGVGSISGRRLQRWLESTSISLAPTVSDDAITLDGQTSPADVEEFFQLLHLYLTSPRRDTVAFRRYQARLASLAKDRERDPDAVFSDSVTALLSGGDPHALKSGASFYSAMRLDGALDFWKRRTANGAGFAVAVVGDFTLARVRPLVERYLASIPQGDAERPRGRGGPLVTGAVRRELRSGVDARARTAIGFTGPFVMSNDSMNALGAVREAVERAVTERLRDRMGGTYYVSVSLAIDPAPPSRYRMTIEFESAPERIDALNAAAMDELARLQRDGPSEAEFVATREARARDFDDRMEDNDFWAGELTYHARLGWSLAGIVDHRREAEAMTLADLRRACATYLPARDYVRVVMRPRSVVTVAP